MISSSSTPRPPASAPSAQPRTGGLRALRLLPCVCLAAMTAGHAFACLPPSLAPSTYALAWLGRPQRVPALNVHWPREARWDGPAASRERDKVGAAPQTVHSAPEEQPQAQTQQPVSPPATTLDEADAALALKSVRARALLGMGDVGQARETAGAVLKVNPDDVAALTVMALADETEDRWRQAAQYWTRINDISANPEAVARRDALKAMHPTEVGVTAFFEGSSGVDEQYGLRAGGAWRALDGPEWTALLETRQAEAGQVVLLDGAVSPVSLNRQRIDIGAADTMSFGRLSLNVTAAQNGAGVRASYGRTTPWGKFEMFAAANEPYWLFSAGLANEARTDYVGASAAFYTKTLGARLAVRQSNYGVEDDDSIARSTRATAGVDVSLSDQPNSLRLSYVLDAEYFDRIDKRSGIGGALYTPMPFTNREVHSFGVYQDFGDKAKTFATIGAGYRDDRYGSNGTFASFSGELALDRDVRLGVRLEYSEISTRGLNENSYSFGEAYVRRVF